MAAQGPILREAAQSSPPVPCEACVDSLADTSCCFLLLALVQLAPVTCPGGGLVNAATSKSPCPSYQVCKNASQCHYVFSNLVQPKRSDKEESFKLYEKHWGQRPEDQGEKHQPRMIYTLTALCISKRSSDQGLGSIRKRL